MAQDRKNLILKSSPEWYDRELCILLCRRADLTWTESIAYLGSQDYELSKSQFYRLSNWIDDHAMERAESLANTDLVATFLKANEEIRSIRHDLARNAILAMRNNDFKSSNDALFKRAKLIPMMLSSIKHMNSVIVAQKNLASLKKNEEKKSEELRQKAK